MTARPYNRVLGLVRVLLVYLLVAALIALSRPRPLGVALGFLIVALGEALRIWAAGHLSKTIELVTTGPYRHVRHPLYLGRLLIFSGLCVMASLPYGANWLVLAAGHGLFFGYYLRRKERVEPERLARVHGEAYRRYHAAVPALIPAGRPYAESGRERWSAGRLLRNREHWMVGGLLLVTALLLWKAYRG